MSVVGNQLHQRTHHGVAFKNQTVNNTSVNGAAIVEPWRLGHSIRFLVNASDFAATTDVTIKLEARSRATGSWGALNIKGTSTQLAFTATLFDDGGGGESVVTSGEVDFADIDTESYSAIRVVVANAVATAALIAISYEINDLYRRPSSATDDLWAKARAAS